jgi:penicillin-binding protein 2
MQPEKLRVKAFGRRAAVLAGAKIALLGGLCGRLYYLQVLESKRYQMLADENRINLRLLAPPRGHIVDRHGAPLAVNVQNYRVVMVPEQALDVQETLERLNTIINVSEYDRRRVLREARRRRAFVPITVRENLRWEEVSRIEVNAPDLPGISIDVGQSRHYPNGDIAAHVMGYVAAVSEKDQTGDPLLELPGFRIGKNGVERQYDLALRGTAGNSQVEVNAIGRVIKELERAEGRPGRRVVLTLDADLQRFVTERLSSHRRAASVVIDVRSGEVLSMVSVPSFDPNGFNEGLDAKTWRSLIENPDTPLSNKAISGQYAPGSTFKPAVMLAALENGISPDHSVFCSGFMELGDQRFHCWHKHGHGLVNMVDAMRESCDVYFYELALKLGVDRIAAVSRQLGLGTLLDIDLPGESAGLIPTRAWKREQYGKPWLKGETLVAAIGQGYVLTTPLQLAVMTARAVNGGYAVLPRLTRETIDDGNDLIDVAEFPHTGISKRSRQLLMHALDEAVNHPRGTAYQSRLTETGHAIGGKTGTAQVRRITMVERESESGVRKNREKPWRERDHSLFVGYAPVDRPVYAVSVVVEHGGGGSKTAAPIARDILREAQRRRAPGQLALEGKTQ